MADKLIVITNNRHQLHKPNYEIDDMKIIPHQEQPSRIVNIEVAIRTSDIEASFIETSIKTPCLGEEILDFILEKRILEIHR